MSNSNEKDFIFEDISSTSPTFKKATKEYGEGAFRHIDKVIKVIAFIVAIALLFLFFAIAAVLIMLDNSFKVIALGVIVIGVVISLISLFLIFGIGHIITQNKQILRRL